MSKIFLQFVNYQRNRNCLLYQKYINCRKCSDTPKKFINFDNLLQSRREQAKRSIIVQVSSCSSFDELYLYCSQFGDVNGIHHYSLRNDGQNFMLVEFQNESSLIDIIKNGSTHKAEPDVMPIVTPYLWFRAADTKKSKVHVENAALAISNGTKNYEENDVVRALHECSTISEQIQKLYDITCLNDLGIRLRYMVARQLEMVFQCLYSNVSVLPFGSSVNGFGKMGCDLDLILNNSMENAKSTARLVFHTKKSGNGGVKHWQRHMEVMADLLQLYVPGCSHVRRILQARVPIIKYNQDFTGIECDMTAGNLSGLYMSELLYLYGSMDSRVRPLVFAVRKWASCVGITNSSPGRWITNFPLTLMVIFFLQQKTSEGAILPPLSFLVKHANKEDIRTTEDQINCTFARDLNRLPLEMYTTNKSDLETLLFQFFEYYAQFDFKDRAISINEGVTIRKTNHTALYIVNPLENTLNVSRNVSFEECERLRVQVRNAAWNLESKMDDNSVKDSDWGLLKIFQQPGRSINHLLRVGNSHRLLSIADLYKEDDSDTLGENGNQFKSVQVENAVKKIKQEKKLFNQTSDKIFNNRKPLIKR